jgi:hypothetical protein
MSNLPDEETDEPLLADHRNYNRIEVLYAGSKFDTAARQGAASSFRTLLCIIFSSAACVRVKQRAVKTKFQSGDIWLWTRASASSR